MKARVKLPNKTKELVYEEVEKLNTEAQEAAALRMILMCIHILRFRFGFKKRLDDFMQVLTNENERTIDFLSDYTFAEKYVEEIERSGYALGGAFEPLIEYEAKKYRKVQEKRQYKKYSASEQREFEIKEMEFLKGKIEHA